MAVFLPLLVVTWNGLGLAAHACGNLSSRDPKQATRPFLQLWESGFDGRLPWWARFGDIAVTAVFLISMLLLMSSLHALSRHRAQRAADLAHDAHERRLGILLMTLGRTQLLLNSYRLESPDRFAAALTGVADRLKTLAEDTAAAQGSVERTMTNVGALTDSLDDTVRRMTDAIPTLGDASQRIEAIVQQGMDALGAGQAAALAAVEDARDATIRAGDQSAGAVRDVADQLRQAGNQVEGAVRTLTSVQQDLVDRSDAVAEAAARTADAMQSTARQTADSIGELRRIVERWDAAAARRPRNCTDPVLGLDGCRRSLKQSSWRP